MSGFQAIAIATGLAFALVANAEDTIEPLPRDLEIQLALSALPPHLRDHSTVYVLNPESGFEVARKGINGFHTLVARTGDDTFRGSWPFTAYRDDVLYPVSFDQAGSQAHMRVFLDAAEMQAIGTPPGELKKIVQNRFRTGIYKAPERAGVSYMLSPILRTYTNPEVNGDIQTVNYPHVMYFAPDVSDEDIGGGKPGGAGPFLIMPGHHGLMIQPRGQKETAAITEEYSGMLAILCRIKSEWCLPVTKGADQ